MKFIIDHDYHIHTYLSICSNDPTQNKERILQYAQKHGLKQIILTDHYWDKAVYAGARDDFYEIQDHEYIRKALPLPQAEGIEFLFGCETDMDKENRLGIPKEKFDDFAFIIVPTTHLHMHAADVENFSPEYRARLWVERLECVLNADLPFHKVGIPHLTCRLINHDSKEAWKKTMDAISSKDMRRLFTKAATLGVGIEINADDVGYIGDEVEYFRMYEIAKECGCKFYLGSDAHHPEKFDLDITLFQRAIDYLGLEESDKFRI